MSVPSLRRAPSTKRSRAVEGVGDGSVMGFPRGQAIRRDAGLWGYERALARHGLTPVAGADEAGRGACAGPLVAAACVLPEGKRGQVPELADSKVLTPAARERVYRHVVRRAVAYHVVVVPPQQVDRIGLHVANVVALRQAVAGLAARPAYVLTDGFPVPGLGVPGLAIWKGDAVAACVAAASVLAKVTRDRIMVDLGERYPAYDFGSHKGYVTPEHNAALAVHGPCPEHRFSYVNVARVCGGDARPVDRVGGPLLDGDNDPVGDLLSDPVSDPLTAELASWA